MAPLARTMSRVEWVRIVLATGLLALTTVAITWPLFRHPASTVLDTESLYGPASVLIQRDINLNIWTLAWDSHALVTDPLHLFHANAFYPARYTLALFDHLLGIVPLFAPVYWATANPVLAHQVALLLSFVLAGLGMTAYVLYWTEDEMAALAAGFLYTFARSASGSSATCRSSPSSICRSLRWPSTRASTAAGGAERHSCSPARSSSPPSPRTTWAIQPSSSPACT